MSRKLRNSLLIGASALMLLSVSAPATQQVVQGHAETVARAARRRVRKPLGRHAKRNKTRVKSAFNLPYQQPVTRTVNGKSAMYNKPADERGAKVVASRQLMRTFAKSHRFGHYVMAYRKAVTSKGTYYKVVSYNFQLRGWVPAKSLHSAKTTKRAKFSTKKLVYFKHPNKARTYVYPIRSLIYNPTVAKGVRTEAHDPLRITAARMTYRGHVKSVFVHDHRNPNIDGWIKSRNVAKRPKVKSNRQFSRKSEIRVNFKHNGRIVKSALLPSGTARRNVNVTRQMVKEDGPLSNSAWANGELAGMKYAVSLKSRTNRKALRTIRSGHTVTLNTYLNDQASSKLALHVEPQLGAQSGMDIDNSGQVGSDRVGLPSTFSRAEVKTLRGDAEKGLNFNQLESLFFMNNGNLSSLTGTATYYKDASGNQVYVPQSDIANAEKTHQLYHYTYKYDSNRTESANQGKKYGSIVDAYFQPVQVNGAAPSTAARTPKNASRVLAGVVATLSGNF